MFFKKDKTQGVKEQRLKELTQASKKAEISGNSPLLERYLQKSMTDHMRDIDDEAIAKAIQTLLHEEKNKNKHLN